MIFYYFCNCWFDFIVMQKALYTLYKQLLHKMYIQLANSLTKMDHSSLSITLHPSLTHPSPYHAFHLPTPTPTIQLPPSLTHPFPLPTTLPHPLFPTISSPPLDLSPFTYTRNALNVSHHFLAICEMRLVIVQYEGNTFGSYLLSTETSYPISSLA